MLTCVGKGHVVLTSYKDLGPLDIIPIVQGLSQELPIYIYVILSF